MCWKALRDFEGHWRLARRLHDRKTGLDGLLTGQAGFWLDGDGLLYEERGKLHLPDRAPMTATRRYRWREAEGGIRVLFDDGENFHCFDHGIDARATHHCGEDRYLVRYAFAEWPHWRAIWSVKGPRKDYRLVSDYWPV